MIYMQVRARFTHTLKTLVKIFLVKQEITPFGLNAHVLVI
jgi:hypothetical protein